MLRDKHVVAARELLGESTDFYSRYIAALDKVTAPLPRNERPSGCHPLLPRMPAKAL